MTRYTAATSLVPRLPLERLPIPRIITPLPLPDGMLIVIALGTSGQMPTRAGGTQPTNTHRQPRAPQQPLTSLSTVHKRVVPAHQVVEETGAYVESIWMTR